MDKKHFKQSFLPVALSLTALTPMPFIGTSVALAQTQQSQVDGTIRGSIVDENVLRQSMRISLKEEATNLKGVEVVAYGVQKKVTVTGASSIQSSGEPGAMPLKSSFVVRAHGLVTHHWCKWMAWKEICHLL